MPALGTLSTFRPLRGSRKRNDGTSLYEENRVLCHGDGTLEIVLDRGQSALIDVNDYSRIVGFHWYARRSERDNTYYATASVLHFTVRMHALVLGVDEEIDHQDGNGLNNRRVNLRPCNRGYNMHHRGLRRDNKLGVRNVAATPSGKFISYITKDGRRWNLGTFQTVEDASAAYRKAVAELYGDFSDFLTEVRCSTQRNP